MNTVKTIDKKREEKLDTIKKLARQADEQIKKGIPQEFEFPTSLNEEDKVDISIIKDVQNPEVSYRLYYGIRSLLLQNLPSQKEFRKLREYIYELKNVFLNRGKQKDAYGLRKSDGRQAYISADLKVMFELVVNWVKNGAIASDLITQLMDLNDERGYPYDGSKEKTHVSNKEKKK